jgi:hypothetical protein
VDARPRSRDLPALRELGIDFVPYSDLGRGFLSGAGNPPTICSIREASVSKPHRPRPLGTTSGSATRLDSVDAMQGHRVGDRQVRRGRSSNTRRRAEGEQPRSGLLMVVGAPECTIDPAVDLRRRHERHAHEEGRRGGAAAGPLKRRPRQRHEERQRPDQRRVAQDAEDVPRRRRAEAEGEPRGRGSSHPTVATAITVASAIAPLGSTRLFTAIWVIASHSLPVERGAASQRKPPRLRVSRQVMAGNRQPLGGPSPSDGPRPAAMLAPCCCEPSPGV